jgi:hypothetical protein
VANRKNRADVRAHPCYFFFFACDVVLGTGRLLSSFHWRLSFLAIGGVVISPESSGFPNGVHINNGVYKSSSSGFLCREFPLFSVANFRFSAEKGGTDFLFPVTVIPELISGF